MVGCIDFGENVFVILFGKDRVGSSKNCGEKYNCVSSFYVCILFFGWVVRLCEFLDGVFMYLGWCFRFGWVVEIVVFYWLGNIFVVVSFVELVIDNFDYVDFVVVCFEFKI